MALVPTAAGFVWSAGLLALAGVELDLFSMFAAVTCIGIAVNYGIYVLYRYALDGTPVLDVKPYLPPYDSVPEARLPEWALQPGSD